MSLTAVVTMECEGCGAEYADDLAKDQTPNDLVDQEGWNWAGVLLDKLLCDTCFEKEDE